MFATVCASIFSMRDIVCTFLWIFALYSTPEKMNMEIQSVRLPYHSLEVESSYSLHIWWIICTNSRAIANICITKVIAHFNNCIFLSINSVPCISIKRSEIRWFFRPSNQFLNIRTIICLLHWQCWRGKVFLDRTTLI